ncbi:uncharacterized protein C8A04DRAFT_24130 [Dichotomopilus funicola]|uniref:Lipid droplet-associated hydrolase n=1 Tax=Dichotomopilus funicola TaxID=1934379 RepID=A0AAN6VDW4_9PEZI|nr:hypothetical protein C8A04DRAFT_24130 [Dichotomopilus funicola]
MEDTAPRPTAVVHDQVPFLQYPSPHKDDANRRQYLIYLIPGNPGLVGYYVPFMTTLRQLLNETESTQGSRHSFHIYGRNLLGFDDRDHQPLFGTSTSAANASGDAKKTEPFNLDDQINGVCENVRKVATSTLANGRVFDHVILIGHSVGAYIALETFHRHLQDKQTTRSSEIPNPTLAPLSQISLTSGILLFPTVYHIARSPSGRKLDLLRTIGVLDRTAHHLARYALDVLPGWAVSGVVRRVLGFPEHAADATLGFLNGRDGVWQALHLGKDEMKVIGEETWAEEMWEIQEAEGKQPGAGPEQGESPAKFYFYFGTKDHWVADECRDEFIERRRQHEKGRTRVVIDEGGVPHAFCIHHSESVAEKVRSWVEDIAGL